MKLSKIKKKLRKILVEGKKHDERGHSCHYYSIDGVGFKIFCRNEKKKKAIKAEFRFLKEMYEKYPSIVPRPLNLFKVRMVFKYYDWATEEYLTKMVSHYCIAMEHVEGKPMKYVLREFELYDDDYWGLCASVLDNHPLAKEYEWNDLHGANIIIFPDYSGFKLIDIDPYYIKKRAA